MTRLFIKLLGLFLIGGMVSSCSDSTTVPEYLEQAQSAIAAKDQNRAIIALKNAARIEPKNPDARFYLASAYIEQGDYFSAEKEIDKALAFGAQHPFIYAKLIEIKLKLRKFDEAFSVVELAEKRPDDEFIAVLTFAGIAALYNEDDELAKDYIDRAIGISGDSSYGKLGEVYLSYADENYGQSLKVVDGLLEQQPDFIEALLLKGFLLQNSKQYQKAAETFLSYAKQRPKEIHIHYLIAQNYINAYQFDLAEPRVDFLLKLLKNEPYANQLKAQIAFQKQDYVMGKKHAEIAVQQNESFRVARIIAGFSAYKLDDFEQAYQHLIKVKDDVASDHVVNKLLIDLQLRLGYDSDALTSLRSMTNVNEMDSSLLTNASYQLLQSGKVEEAKELLKTSISLNTQNPAELAKQGLIQFQLQQSEQGINLLEKALALDPELSFAENMLAATYLQAEQFDDALKMAKEWQADKSKAARGYLLESSILLQNKQIEEAKLLLEEALTYEPNNIPALYKLALYEHKNNNSDKAFSYYTKVLNLRPNHVGAVKNLVVLVRQAPELSERATTFYNGMLAMSPDDEHALFGLSYIYKANKQYDEAVATFKRLIEVGKSISGVELALGDIYKLQGQWQKSIDTYRSYLTANPKNLAAAHKIFSVFEQLNQIDKSLEQVEKTRLHYPNNKGLLLLKIYYQSMLRQHVSIVDIESLKKSQVIKGHWLFEKTLGNLALNNEDALLAAKHYKQAYLQESNEQNALNWAKAVGLNNNYKESVKVLEQYLSTQPISINAKVMLSSAYSNLNQPLKASKLLREVLKSNENNVIALNNLALLELEHGDSKEALKYGEQVVKLVANNAIILDTYAQALAGTNNIDKAIVVYDQALAYADETNKVEIMLHKARSLKLGNKLTLLSGLISELENDTSIVLTNSDKREIEKLKN